MGFDRSSFWWDSFAVQTVNGKKVMVSQQVISHLKKLASESQRSLCIVCCLALFAINTGAQSDDQTSLRVLAEQFLAAYQKKDLNRLMSLWDDRSPDLAATRKAFEQDFAANRFELQNARVTRVIIERGKATVRIVADTVATDANPASPTPGSAKLNRTLLCLKMAGAWTVARYLPSEEDLATELISAKSEEERNALLAAERELVTIDLRRALVSQGHRLRRVGSFAQAMLIYQLALTVAQDSADRPGAALALESLGVTYYSQGKYADALEYLERSLRIYEEIGDKAGIAGALIDIGNVNFSQGNFTRAEECYQRCLRIRVEIGDKSGTSTALNNMGNLHRSRGDYTRALEYLERSLKNAEETGDKEDIARALTTMGGVFYLQGDYPQAIEHLEQSLKTLEATGSKGLIARTLNNIGNVYRDQGNYSRALECYQRSLKIKEETEDKEGIGNTLNNMGTIQAFQGNYGQALNYYQRSLRIAEELKSKEGIGRGLNNIAGVLNSQGNYNESLEYYGRCLKIREETGEKPGIASTLNGIADVRQHQGRYTESLDVGQKSLKILEEIGDKNSTARTLSQQAFVHYLQGNYKLAVEVADRAAAVARQIGSAEPLWRARSVAGRAHHALGQSVPARQALAESISTLEGLRARVAGGELAQQQSFGDKIGPYHAMIDLLIEERDIPEAVAFAERYKGRVLLDVLQSGKVDIIKALSSTEREQERKSRNDIVSLNSQIQHEQLAQRPDPNRLGDLDRRLQQARLDYEALQTNLHAAHPELKFQRGETQPITLRESCALIPDTRTALLEFAMMEDKTHVFVLTRKDEEREAIPNLKVYTLNIKETDLADRVERFRRSLADRSVTFHDPARELYDLLLGPANAALQGKSKLIIVPDRALWQLPFQALQPSPNRFLIEEYAISYAPSLTVLREMMTLKQKRQKSASVRGHLLHLAIRISLSTPRTGSGQC